MRSKADSKSYYLKIYKTEKEFQEDHKIFKVLDITDSNIIAYINIFTFPELYL